MGNSWYHQLVPGKWFLSLIHILLQYSALAIFLLGAAGLADHSMLLKTGHIRPGFFCFYTNLSNIWLLLYQILLFFAGFSPEGALWRVLTDVRVSTGMTLSKMCIRDSIRTVH